MTVNEKKDGYDTAIWMVPTAGDEAPRQLTSGPRDAGPLAQLARRIKRIQRYDGVRLRAGGRATPPTATRAADLRAHLEGRARPWRQAGTLVPGGR